MANFFDSRSNARAANKLVNNAVGTVLSIWSGGALSGISPMVDKAFDAAIPPLEIEKTGIDYSGYDPNTAYTGAKDLGKKYSYFGTDETKFSKSVESQIIPGLQTVSSIGGMMNKGQGAKNMGITSTPSSTPNIVSNEQTNTGGYDISKAMTNAWNGSYNQPMDSQLKFYNKPQGFGLGNTNKPYNFKYKANPSATNINKL